MAKVGPGDWMSGAAQPDGGFLLFAQATDASGNPTGTSANPTSTQAAPLAAGTDRSGIVGTAAIQLAPTNPARRGLNIQNISTANLGINEIGGTAAIGSAGTYTLAAGASLNVRTNRAISIIASAASSAYTATEF
ncbi:hypothetical protein [Sphingomonas sp. MA1305]|uniref:hypothetical protein n=1 Tax=Sphingomonas sp. MA1305 TaxID=2479204 RepID=UPI0018DFEA04|nr:hypothetical protein [Sphingomonas sp. MA1305]